MSVIISVDDFAKRFPRPLTEAEQARAELLIADALEIISAEFSREGRDFDDEVQAPWLAANTRRVVFEMVNTAILVGGNAGVKQHSITVGGVTESSTWADPYAANWGVLWLTDAQRALLGLSVAVTARASYPPAKCWPERW